MLALADDGVLGGAGEGAVGHRRDDRPLLVGNLLRRGLPHVVVHREVRARPTRRTTTCTRGRAVRAACCRARGRPCTRPDRSARAGSCGRRWRPASRRRRCRVGASTAFRMSCTGRCRSAFDQSTGGSCCARSNRLRAADQVFLRRVWRKHRPHLVLLAVEPRDEEHLHGAAAIPVALLVVRPDSSDAGAETLHVHRREARVARAPRRPSGTRRSTSSPVVPTLPFDHDCFEIHVHRVVAVGRAAGRGCRSSLPRRSAPARSARRRRSRA